MELILIRGVKISAAGKAAGKDEMKMKKATVSMGKYSPKFNYIKINRYKGASIGYGQRYTLSTEKGPGPGAYKIPRIFDRGVKRDLVIN